MRVFVNEKHIDVAEQATLVHVLETVNVRPGQKGIAVAVNDRVVRRADWQEHVVAPDDRIEIIQATQGG